MTSLLISSDSPRVFSAACALRISFKSGILKCAWKYSVKNSAKITIIEAIKRSPYMMVTKILHIDS